MKEAASTIKTATTSEPSPVPVGALPPSPGPSALTIVPHVRTSTRASAESMRFIGIPPFIRRSNNPDIISEAIAFYCTGKYAEARALLNRLYTGTTGDEQLSVMNWLAKTARAMNENEHAITIHLASEHLVPDASEALKGGHHIGFGNSRLLQGDTESARRHFEHASRHYRNANYFENYAIAENNLAYLLIQEGKADEALSNLHHAREILDAAGMAVQVAIVDDTLANAYLKLNLLDEAYSCADCSIRALRQAGEVETLKTSIETMREILAAMKGERCD